MKIVFMGTPDFSAMVLERLNRTYPVAAVVTGLDKPAGRGHEVKPSPIKELAMRLGIKVLQFASVSKEGIEAVRALAPDLVVTAAFGQILSEEFLAIPKFGVLNVHASLLPKYRGASPIQWAILNGERTTGITVMRTVRAVDAGDILLQKAIEIGDKETAGELFDRLAALGGEAITEAVAMIERGEAEFVRQDERLATHCGMIKKEDGRIDFGRTAKELDCFVRGMTPWPSAFTTLNGKLLKVYEIALTDLPATGSECGEVVAADAKNGLAVRVSDGVARLSCIQLEGAKRMSDIEFLKGRQIEIGTRLGEYV